MRDINEVAEKMARNGFKIAKSLGCAFRFESEFIYSLDHIFLGIKLFRFSRQKAELFSICLKKI